MNKYKPKILIVDDDPTISSLMAFILKDEGYELFFAINGRDGLEKVIAIHPDLIFLDMCMPVLDGIGFLKELNELCSVSCPVLAITGLKDDLVMNEGFEQGIFSLIHKPFCPNEILALCRRYTRLTKFKKRLSFNIGTVGFLSKQASSFGLDSLEQQDLIEALPLPVFVKNRDRVVIQVNRAFEVFIGLDRGAIVGRICEEICSDKKFVVSNHEAESRLVENGGLFCQEQIIADRQGGSREVIICRSAVINESCAQPVGILGIMIDITEFGFFSFKKMLASRYPELSTREREVANLVRLGMSNKEVARQLNIALCTVEFHRTNLREKLGLEKGKKINLSTALLAL